MTKTTISATIDADLRRQAKENGLNISNFVNESLKDYFAITSENLSEIGVEIEQKRLKKAQKELEKWQKEAQNAQKRLEIWQENKEKEVTDKLEEEKKRLESQKTCINCKAPKMPELLIKFPAGLVCRGCYQSCSGDDIKRWNDANNAV